MSKLNIYCLNDIAEKNCIVSLPQGDHIIGRGNLLQIKDKRVSRNHALIQVTEQHITLKSIHENPCFFRAHNGQCLTILRQNKTNPLEDGDQFALLPDDLWFRVRVQKEPLNETLLKGKRPSEDESLDITSKKQKLTESDAKETEPQNEDWEFKISEYYTDTVPTSLHNETEPVKEGEAVPEVTINNDRESSKEAASQATPNNEAQQVNEGEAALEVKQEPEDVSEEAIKIKEEPTSSSQEEPKSSNQEKPAAIEAKVKPAPADVLNEARGTDSSDQNGAQDGNGGQQPKKTYRERCWYGQRCFRRNPNHREQFAHPGDQDYQSDPEDDRPLCPYGATCYRINPEHRRDYKHLGKPAPKPPAGQSPVPPGSPPDTNTTGQSPAKKKRAPKKKPKKDQSFDSEDDYDYDDPFLNDDSEDDYEPTDLEGSSDDEFKDSQDSKGLTEEESQERKRMLREAKKFLRGDKKKKKDDDAEDD